MRRGKRSPAKPKISAEFSARLARLKPADKIRAIVMLEVERGGKARARRISPAQRQAAIDAIGESAKEALVEVDDILLRFEGKRLALTANALGYLPIETTRAGIEALAESEQVKAVLEDQPISLLRKPKA